MSAAEERQSWKEEQTQSRPHIRISCLACLCPDVICFRLMRRNEAVSAAEVCVCMSLAEVALASAGPVTEGELSCWAESFHPLWLLGVSERLRSRRWDYLKVFPGSSSPREQQPEPAKWSRYWSSHSALQSLWTSLLPKRESLTPN